MPNQILRVAIGADEYWWGCAVNCGHFMPIGPKDSITIDPDHGRENDQFASLFLSSRGRYIWSDHPFVFTAEKGEITCAGNAQIALAEGYENLRGAYLAASRAHFPFTGTLPHKDFFTKPQYNTWIELETEQTTDNILRYAKGIRAHGLPGGILMIDEGWQEDYGVFEFNKSKIPDPAALVDGLHQMGFSVMLWVTPMVAGAGTRYRQLVKKDYLLRRADGEIAIRKWWNGYSAVLDLTNPEANAWYHEQLHALQRRYGVDGFKFDAGDRYFYEDDDRAHTPMPAREQTAVFNRVGVQYPLNEFRAAWNFGGQPIVARLHDKRHGWTDFGLDTLIPHTVLQGLLGYAYCCPDMVGGGQISCFNGESPLDEELFVRWAQANVYLGMMQMSIAPWRVLRPENAALVVDALARHEKLGEKIYALARETARSGEPIIRAMAYQFPGEGFETVQDQFMLGEDLLVAPVLEKGAASRSVLLPKGTWQGWNGQTYAGGQRLSLPVTLSDIPCFTRVSAQ